MSNHPITPPPELVREWTQNRGYSCADELWDYLAAQAAQWGADQELDACCEWLVRNYSYPEAGNPLRAARRPKPPTLKEQALALLQPGEPRLFNSEMQDTIRRALEALPND